MYDTVNLWLDISDISLTNPFKIQQYLSNITEHNHVKRGCSSCTGTAGDYKVTIWNSGISLKGSLAKYYLGNNIETLTLPTTEQAIKQLSDHIHLDLTPARVTRLDVSTVIKTVRTPSDYYSYLGDKPYFKRLCATKNTLYYITDQEQLIFYDKKLEAKKKNIAIPKAFINDNLFRYELRFLNHIANQLKTNVTAATLYDEIFYKRIINKWSDEFKEIKKIKQQNFMIDNVTTIREAEAALFAYLLQQSGQNTIDDFLSELKAQKKFKDRQRYAELKRKLHKQITASIEQKNDLIKELEQKISIIAESAI